MFEQGDDDLPFDVVFSECAPTIWLLVNECFNDDGGKGCDVVFMSSIHMGVDKKLGACFGLAE